MNHLRFMAPLFPPTALLDITGKEMGELKLKN
jgi:hypothetical protein